MSEGSKGWQHTFFDQANGFLAVMRYIPAIRNRLSPQTQIDIDELGVNVIGESQLVGYPSQFPSVSMIDYNNAKPNARYWVLKMLVYNLNFHPGDVMEITSQPSIGHNHPVLAQGYQTPHGHRILVINTSDESQAVKAPSGFANASHETVDESTGDNAPHTGTLEGRALTLSPFAVTVLDAE